MKENTTGIAAAVAPEVVVLSPRVKQLIQSKLTLMNTLRAETDELIMATLEAKGVVTDDKKVTLNADYNIEVI